MTGLRLELDDLLWEHGGGRRALSPRRLAAAPGRVAVVLAPDSGEADAFTDLLVGESWPRKGTIRISGQEITSLGGEDRGIALVPAGGGLFPHLTVEQNIAFGMREDRRGAYRRGYVAYVAGRLNLQGMLAIGAHELSPDERLRVALARAMCRWQAARAVVVEDRTGHPPCHAAVSETLNAYPDLPVVVVSDDGDRVAALRGPALSWEVVAADGP
ncbi:hypothetical protein Sme01_30040 [Sphaerisporangium melleum]|uniref:ABC transporter domain-containing protein n=1 Tax=Sphaerisporangium melleum TaxID=321316 RepID=A0A917R2S6_9ACTN|nr:ATP-binding cassette domain-containing protein [Sphaerisporangium melleum]GGK85331.1 hypothetical protein GCM10007964_29820 [Sphaerisporangium melleum]GII70528.1 hypothetical protein Sme01_30040 [Sphaerisporangium melleum]